MVFDVINKFHLERFLQSIVDRCFSSYLSVGNVVGPNNCFALNFNVSYCFSSVSTEIHMPWFGSGVGRLG